MQQVEVIVVESEEESQVQEIKDVKSDERKEEILNDESKTTAADGDEEPEKAEQTVQAIPDW